MSHKMTKEERLRQTFEKTIKKAGFESLLHTIIMKAFDIAIATEKLRELKEDNKES